MKHRLDHAPLARAQLPRDTLALARWLIGKTLVRRLGGQVLAGRIVETEAYRADDPASHSFRGETPRNAAMYLRRGHAYVYRIYGVWYCLNVASGAAGAGEAVLLRALEPIEGAAVMKRNRARPHCAALARGPGCLCQALQIGPECDGVDLCAPGALFLAAPIRPAGPIGISPRIGITKAAELPWRFYERDNPHVSGPKRLNG